MRASGATDELMRLGKQTQEETSLLQRQNQNSEIAEPVISCVTQSDRTWAWLGRRTPYTRRDFLNENFHIWKLCPPVVMIDIDFVRLQMAINLTSNT